MSLFKCKDLDYLLAQQLDETSLKSLLSFSTSNKYYYNLLDDKFYLNLYLKKYSSHLAKFNHLCNFKNFTKQTYFENEKYLRNLTAENIYQANFFAIASDRVDMLVISSFLFPTLSSCRYIDLSIEKDSLKCFRYFFEQKNDNNRTNIDEYYVDSTIRHKSDKILKYLFKYSYVRCTATRFDIAFHSYSPKFVELYLMQMQKIGKCPQGTRDKPLYFCTDLLEEIVYQLCYPYNDNSSWIDKFNPAFALFMKFLTREQILSMKQVCLARDQYVPIKLITAYTSFFNKTD